MVCSSLYDRSPYLRTLVVRPCKPFPPGDSFDFQTGRFLWTWSLWGAIDAQTGIKNVYWMFLKPACQKSFTCVGRSTGLGSFQNVELKNPIKLESKEPQDPIICCSFINEGKGVWRRSGSFVLMLNKVFTGWRQSEKNKDSRKKNFLKLHIFSLKTCLF